MPRPSQRSRSFIKRKVSTPGGKSSIHYVKKKPSKARCGSCKKPLHGVPTDFKANVKKLSKTQRRPERPYGGNLCSSCTKEVIRKKIIERWSE